MGPVDLGPSGLGVDMARDLVPRQIRDPVEDGDGVGPETGLGGEGCPAMVMVTVRSGRRTAGHGGPTNPWGSLIGGACGACGARCIAGKSSGVTGDPATVCGGEEVNVVWVDGEPNLGAPDGRRMQWHHCGPGHAHAAGALYRCCR